MSESANSDDRLVPGTLCACVVILAYDWICTFDQELAYVWSRPFSLGTVIFALNRYLPFIDIPVAFFAKFMRITPEDCLRRNELVGWMSAFGLCISEGILILRTYALWERKRSVLIVLCTMFLMTLVVAFVTTYLELRSLHYSDVQTDGVGCTLAKAGSVIIFGYLMLLVSETVIVILTAIKAYRDLRFARLPWLVQLYREGILFYVYIFAISLANILVPALAPSRFSNWLASPQRVLHSVLCTRVLLLIRRQAVYEDPDLDRGTHDYVQTTRESEVDTRLSFATREW
ncbi:hypothetical protein FB45DRAFT_60813 [Roridomyces roridus]|uniref:DUF6533 domain-containing protein n=1 Tax=Roridomyces roridus TaxID=1738132 RepID=A0AAD7BQG9_9AGAR|nr:hypothetical protein FB45DRAFT_60813 [Roridomyces roridus]